MYLIRPRLTHCEKIVSIKLLMPPYDRRTYEAEQYLYAAENNENLCEAILIRYSYILTY